MMRTAEQMIACMAEEQTVACMAEEEQMAACIVNVVM